MYIKIQIELQLNIILFRNQKFSFSYHNSVITTQFFFTFYIDHSNTFSTKTKPNSNNEVIIDL